MKKLKYPYVILYFFILLFICFAQPILAQSETGAQKEQMKEHVLATSVTFRSKLLNETGKLYITVPRNYDQQSISYPVLYVLDGRTHYETVGALSRVLTENGELIPAMITVSIQFSGRMSKFEFLEERDDPQGPIFLKSILEEIIPYVNKNYRTNSYKALWGHSLGGYFVNYIFLRQPELFQGYIAISPSDYEEETFYQGRLDDRAVQSSYYWLSLGSEGDPPYLDGWNRYSKAVADRENPKWCQGHYTDNTHASIPIISTYMALRCIFSEYTLDIWNEEIKEKFTLDYIKDHYEKLSKSYGYEVPISEEIVIGKASQLMQENKITEATAFLDEQLEKQPDGVYSYLIRGHLEMLAKGQEAAMPYLQKAIQNATAEEQEAIQEILSDLTKQ